MKLIRQTTFRQYGSRCIGFSAMADATTNPVFSTVRELRAAIRDKRAGLQECLDFVKTLDIESKTEGEIPEALATIESLRGELPFEDAVTFLEGCLHCLGKDFYADNPLFIAQIRLMIAEDQNAQRNYQEVSVQISLMFECLSKYPDPIIESFALSQLRLISEGAPYPDSYDAVKKLLSSFSEWGEDDTRSKWVTYLNRIAIIALIQHAALLFSKQRLQEAFYCYSYAASVASHLDLPEYLHWINKSLYLIDVMKSSGQNFSTFHKEEAETVLKNFLRSPCIKRVDMDRLLKSVLSLEITHNWLPQFASSSNCSDNIRAMIEKVAVILILGYELHFNFETKMDEASCLLLNIPIDDLTSAEDSLVKLREVIMHHCSFSKICVLACNYELAEKHLQKAEELVQLCDDKADDRDYAEMRSTIHYVFAVLYYLWRGHMSQTFEHCMLAKKCFRDLRSVRYTALMECVLKHIKIQ